MFNKLTEAIPPPIIGAMVYSKEALSPRAQKAQEAYFSKLEIKERNTKKPLVVCFLGLVGSGKSSVAQELASHIDATVIEADLIRVHLRKENEPYKYVRQISENIVLEILKRGGNVIIDSDQIDDKKRASLREKVKKAGARLVLLRTYTEPHVMFGRMLSAEYRRSPDDFFGGAKSKWEEGTDQERGAVIKFGEAWRRTPHHYRWVNEGGGRWELKKLPFSIFANIDTTNTTGRKDQIEKIAKKLLAL